MYDERHPDDPPSEEELRRAQALSAALDNDEAADEEVAWLRAHLRYPRPEDELGELPARALARHAREELSRRQQADKAAEKAEPRFPQLRRAVGGSLGLLGVAALLMTLSSALLSRPLGARPQGRAVRDGLMRASLQAHESPARRLDLMIEERLSELRGRGYGALGMALP